MKKQSGLEIKMWTNQVRVCDKILTVDRQDVIIRNETGNHKVKDRHDTSEVKKKNCRQTFDY